MYEINLTKQGQLIEISELVTVIFCLSTNTHESDEGIILDFQTDTRHHSRISKQLVDIQIYQ